MNTVPGPHRLLRISAFLFRVSSEERDLRQNESRKKLLKFNLIAYEKLKLFKDYLNPEIISIKWGLQLQEGTQLIRMIVASL